MSFSEYVVNIPPAFIIEISEMNQFGLFSERIKHLSPELINVFNLFESLSILRCLFQL